MGKNGQDGRNWELTGRSATSEAYGSEEQNWQKLLNLHSWLTFPEIIRMMQQHRIIMSCVISQILCHETAVPDEVNHAQTPCPAVETYYT